MIEKGKAEEGQDTAPLDFQPQEIPDVEDTVKKIDMELGTKLDLSTGGWFCVICGRPSGDGPDQCSHPSRIKR